MMAAGAPRRSSVVADLGGEDGGGGFALDLVDTDEGGGHGQDHGEADKAETDTSKNESRQHAGTADKGGGGSFFPGSGLCSGGEWVCYGSHKAMFFLRLEIFSCNLRALE